MAGPAEVEEDLEALPVVQHLCFPGVEEEEPFGHAHDGLHLFDEVGQVEGGEGLDDGVLDDVLVRLDVCAGHHVA